MIRKMVSLRLMTLLWLLVMGGACLWADENVSSGSDGSTTEDVKTFDFTTAEGQALISGLAGSATSWNPSNTNLAVSVNGFPVNFYYCLRYSSKLVVRGDNDGTRDAGYIAGKWQGTLTQVTLVTAGSAYNASQRGNVSIIVEKDGVTYTTTAAVAARGETTIAIPKDKQLTDASSIKIAPNFQCHISKIILTRTVHSTDVKDPWILFKRWNGETISIDDTETHKARVGEMLTIESNGVEGFDPVSSASNPYVVTYTVTEDGSQEPEFSFVSSNGNWKNGNDAYPAGYKGHNEGDPINMHGYVYRRGIVLDKLDKSNLEKAESSKEGEPIVVRVGIFKLKTDANGNFVGGYDKVKEVRKEFLLESSSRPNIVGVSGKDILYSPDTKLKAGSPTGYLSAMTILDPTEHVIVSTYSQPNTIISKFSKNDRYDLQSLLNAVNVTPTVAKKSMKTSSIGLRLLSSFVYTPDGIACNGVAEAWYWFIPARTKLNLELAAERNPIDLTKNKQSKFTLKAYYWDAQNKKQYVDLKNKLHLTKSNIHVGDKYVMGLTSTTEGTTTDDLVFSDDNKTAYFTMLGKDNGVSSLTIKTDATSEVVNGEYVPEAINFTAATYTMNITVKGSNKLSPPSITPATCYYAKDFKAKVKGYEGVKTFYLIIDYSLLKPEEISLQDADGDISSGTTEEDDEDKDIPDPEALVGLAHDFHYDPMYPTFIGGGYFEGAEEVEIPIEAKIGKRITICAVVANVDEDFNIQEKIEDGTTVKDASRVVHSTYTYSKLEAPVLSPGIEGNDHFYPYDGEELEVSASVESPNCQIFYLIGNKNFEFKQNADGTITTNATLYNAENNFKVSGTTMVQAIAYSSTLGLVSEVVTYRYANMASDFDNPTFIVGDGTSQTKYISGQKVRGNVSDKEIRLKAIVYGANAGADLVIGGENDENLDNAKYRIYYTTDGTYPTSNSTRYTGAFKLDNSKAAQRIIALVYANGEDGDGTISDYSILDLLNANLYYWETTTDEYNCGLDGVLKNNTQAITDKDENTLVGIEFGGSKDAADHELNWKHYVSAEYATGNPIDNVGAYTIAPAEDKDEMVADARDELGNLWNHSKSYNSSEEDFQTHKATFGLPASGAYVKFEPRKSGKLTIWCCQEGALYYNNNSSAANFFNKGFLRKRPAYFVDEAGKSIAPDAIVAAGVLSSTWDLYASKGTWIEKGKEQNGIMQDLYTQEQTFNIYQMFNGVILKNGVGYNQSLQNAIVYLNTEGNKMVAGYNVAEEPLAEGQSPSTADEVVDGTGVCLPSASYMKYTFDVKAGKTYFFFGWMTKIGIRGFGFEPNGEDVTDRETRIYSGNESAGTDQDAPGDSNKNNFSAEASATKTYASVTLNRSFKPNTWTTLVLPFSVSATQVKEVFGDKTEIVHYRTIEGRTMYFFKHFHQMIVAGTPVVIKPSKSDEKDLKNPTFENVTFESAKVIDTPCNDYGFKGTDGVTGEENVNTDFKMIGSYGVQTVNYHDYYIGNDGKLYYWGNTESTPLYGTRAYINGSTEDGTVSNAESMAKAAYNDFTPKSMDGDATDIDLIGIGGDHVGTMGCAMDGNVYAVDGTMVRKKGDKLKGLAKGIYIINGKKVVVE